METATVIPSSFRDTSGFLYRRSGRLLRQVNHVFGDDFRACKESGLFEELWAANLLVEHEEVASSEAYNGEAVAVIAPQIIPFISYPYEWCFRQLQAAALCTIEIAERAFARGFMLKDASAYNVQFIGSRPVFIDSLSFERLRVGEPWVAYRQFCQHFLAPLALMAKVDWRFSKLLLAHIDGVPLELASGLLPWGSWANFGLLMHLHLHSRAQLRYGSAAGQGKKVKGQVSAQAMRGLFDGLASAVRALEWRPEGTEWGDYYDATNYTERSLARKAELVADFVGKVGPKMVWDLGANTGHFSSIAAKQGAYTIAFDIDPAAVEKNYRRLRAEKDEQMLPLVLDLTNPTPAFGWAATERSSLAERGPADLILALALVHHLAISNNLPLDRIADYFSKLGQHLIIEFVPKSDSQVRRLLASRKDIFPSYTQDGFERAFKTKYSVIEAVPIEGTERVLYLMERRSGEAG